MSLAIPSGTYPRASSTSGFSLQQAGRAVWRFLQTVGASRARVQLEALACQYDSTNPTLAYRLRESARHSLVD